MVGIFDKLLVSDLEGTITPNEFWEEVAEDFNLHTHTITARAMAGELDFFESLKARVELVRGMDAKALKRAGETVEPWPNVPDFFDALHYNGFITVIVSGGFDFLVERVAKNLGVRHWAANRLIVEDGAVAGVMPLVDGEGKRRFVEELQQHYGIPPERTLILGDGANDLPMMGRGFPIGVDAKPVVAGFAKLAITGRDLNASLLEHPKIKSWMQQDLIQTQMAEQAKAANAGGVAQCVA
ncbi:HAD family phosphatase [Candidatus Micrarchaeota archaeon]|nr:HAD family phosphatase [Candidatus Micrarchaeota archaeon]